MNRGARYKVQRVRRAARKADAVVLLDRIVSMVGGDVPPLLLVEIAEMRMRLAPPAGVTAPIIRTGYTARNKGDKA